MSEEPSPRQLAIERSWLSFRPYRQQLDHLGLTPKDLGRYCLDLGSGKHEEFSRAASKDGIKVVSVNPKLNDPYIAHNAKLDRPKLPQWQGQSLAALAQELPFPDNTFDSILSHAAIPNDLPQDENKYMAAFSEITRILKPGHAAHLGPIFQRHRQLFTHLLQSLPATPDFQPYRDYTTPIKGLLTLHLTKTKPQ